ncbi:MAG: cell division protein FtsZ [Crocinitomicaceae bacterium]|jgi:cell division protein FtsZ|nr:cell division protein FtsZ [Crocinitomicaceae bacterium]MDG1735525.1 cell division protein FtsZ [Crocinitomicaceae bacterium]
MEFDIPKENSSDIKVVGVGGGGSNAVNHMFNQGIQGVDFIICNTDRQALDISPVPYKIQLGTELTEGRGAGMKPEVGENAALENLEDIRELLSQNTKMLFVTAGMGGGTGTGAGPVIAQIAKDLGILTVGIVTVPFNFEGKKRRIQAEAGLERMRQNVDSLLIISNERLRDFGKNMALTAAFAHADDILTVAAKGIAELISRTGLINTDFNDVNTVLRDSGHAIMGSAQAEGEDRAMDAVTAALASPLLNDNDINGANYILLNISYSKSNEITMDEMGEITDYVQEEAGSTADVIFGVGEDEALGDKLSVTIIATGFATSDDLIVPLGKPAERINIPLEDAASKEIKQPLNNPTTSTAESNEEVLAEDEPFVKTVTPIVLENQNVEKEEVALDEEKIVHDLSSDESENSTEDTNDGPIAWEISETIVPENLNEVEAQPDLFAETEVIKHQLDDDVDAETEHKPSAEDHQKMTQDRVTKIQEHTSRLKNVDGITDYEKEPAFKRRSLFLDNSKPSESKPSRFGLSEDEDGGSDLSDNSFLHDNVD